MIAERLFRVAGIGVLSLTFSASAGWAEVGKAGVTAAPCPDVAWTPDDPAFESLPGAKGLSGTSNGSLYRIEIPAAWNGELVLWAHGLVDQRSPQGTHLRAVFPPGGQGQGPTFREHLIAKGFAWAASSYRCNGYVPGVGLLDTVALTDLFTKLNGGTAAQRVYLTGASMGGHITLLGMQEFPRAFAGGLAMCAAGPGQMDFLTAVVSASELITGVTVSNATRDQDAAQLAAVVGQPPAYTARGRQLASVEIQLSGGPRPFALEGLANRLIENVTGGVGIVTATHWNRVATNASIRYTIGDGLGLSAATLNSGVRRISADAVARSARGPYEETIPFDGRIERPVLTMHGTGDLFVPISLEQELKRAVTGAGRERLLVQRVMRIPGHCNFSRVEAARAFDDLVSWVHAGTRPESDEVLGDLSNAGLRFTSPLRPGDPGTPRPAAAAK